MITAIVLTYNERLHIARCIENLRQLTSKIIIVDSLSTDGTQEIARERGATVVEHSWPGSQAAQFNWALDNLDITSPWILRLDADENLTPELVAEIKREVPALPDDVTGIVLNRRRIFQGKWLKHGANDVKILRMFRTGLGRYENRIMDEHILLSSGKAIEFKHDFCDDNLNDIGWFCQKHINYASREAATSLMAEYLPEDSNRGELADSAQKKRLQKSRYARMPLFWRSMAYFVYRYILRGGFLNGKEGFIWDYMQAWWYRTLVDVKILEIKKKCDNDPEKIKQYLCDNFNLRQ